MRGLARALGLALPILVGCALPASPFLRATSLLTVGAATLMVTWRLLLTPEEKAPILDFCAAVRNWGAPIPPRCVAESRAESEFTASPLG